MSDGCYKKLGTDTPVSTRVSLCMDNYVDEDTKGNDFPNRFGFRLSTREFVPQNNSPEAIALFLHRPQSHVHTRSVLKLGTYLASNQIALFSFDFEGHGLSQGQSHLVDFDGVIEDCKLYIDLVHDRFPGVPFFIFAESVSCNLAVLLALEYQSTSFYGTFHSFSRSQVNRPKVLGTVLLSPIFKFRHNTSTYFSWLFRQCCICFNDTYRSFSHYAVLSRDSLAVRAMEVDPLMQFDLEQLKQSQRLDRLLRKVYDRIDEMCFPFLIAHGGSDSIIDLGAVERFFNRSSTLSKHKSKLVLPNARHDILLEIVYEHNEKKYFHCIVQWIRQHL